ncbi:hypothetical protein [Streptomyces sp. DG2A-72]
MTLLEVRNLEVTYPSEADAVRGVDLTPAARPKHGITDESGCSKEATQ